MKATEITIGRQFYLGVAGPAQTPETLSVSISWSLEGETIEEAEAKAVPKLYEMAERERHRRFEIIKAWKAKQPARPEPAAKVEAANAAR